MSLVVLTGPVRSGKSSVAEAMASDRAGRSVTVAVAGWDGDGEMERRIAAHRASRPSGWATLVVGTDPGWIADVEPGALLLLDCLGTLIAHICVEEVSEGRGLTADIEAAVGGRVDGLVAALLDRQGDTIIVTNETGWGVVPEYPSARAFRDEVGRANRRLVDRADAAFLVVDGRCIPLTAYEDVPVWPEDEGNR